MLQGSSEPKGTPYIKCTTILAVTNIRQ
jgi:hypothetical protein